MIFCRRWWDLSRKRRWSFTRFRSWNI